MPTDLLSFGRRVLQRQPFSALLDTRLDALVPGRAELRLPIVARLLQQHGFVHGGALSYLADNALTFAGGSVLGDCVTAEFKINYLRPARGPGTLLALARVTGHGKQQAVCQCDLFVDAADGRTLVAVAQGTIWKLGSGQAEGKQHATAPADAAA